MLNMFWAWVIVPGLTALMLSGLLVWAVYQVVVVGGKNEILSQGGYDGMRRVRIC